MHDIIFVSLENWDEIWRRNQFLCSGLAKRFPQNKILFVGKQRSLPHSILKRNRENVHSVGVQAVPGQPNIYITRPLKVFPNVLPGARRINSFIERRYIRRVARTLNINNPILWLNPHHAVHMVGKMGERSVVYDITDDWALASFAPREKSLIEAHDRLLCQKADLVVVCSQALEQSRRPISKRILLLPNGVEVNHYKAVSEPSGRQTAVHPWPRPVFGYTGTLHRDRVDVHLIAALAKAFPHGSVVLVGPGSLGDEANHVLADCKNVHFIGAVPYSQIPNFMTGFDVCIVPHRETEFTESLNPIKLWEYLACGKPIASSNVAGFRSFAHLCHLGSGPQAFVKACQAALDENGARREARLATAAANSWDCRIDNLLGVLNSAGVA